MEIKARLTDVSRDLKGGFRLTFTTNEDVRSSIDRLSEKDIRLDARIWRERRSLTANAYFHVLKEKIAARLSISLTEIHNRLIAEYGIQDEDVPCLILRNDIDWTRLETIHLRPTSRTKILDDGQLYRAYRVMRGSHTYNTAEMARLIDGTVSEAKELGIETLPPEELERMKRAWRASFGEAMNGSVISADGRRQTGTTAYTGTTGAWRTKTG